MAKPLEDDSGQHLYRIWATHKAKGPGRVILVSISVSNLGHAQHVIPTTVRMDRIDITHRLGLAYRAEFIISRQHRASAAGPHLIDHAV